MKKAIFSLLPFLILLIWGQKTYSQCNAEFTWDQVGGTLEVHFTSTSTSEHDIVSWNWTFGDGQSSDDQNPSHTYNEAGTYNVCLIIEDEVGCVSDVCHMVNVEAPSSSCDAEFTWEQIPGTLQIHFNSTSTSEFDIISYQWNFGDGNEGDGQNPTHTYDEAGEYNVCLIIEDAAGCVSDVCHEVVVEAVSGECDAEFEWEQEDGSLEVHFFSTSTSNFDIISYNWNFGDGNEGDGQNPTHVYDEPGVYLVCLIIEDEEGCVSDVCHEVVVEAVSGECDAEFEWEQEDGSLEVHFFSTSTSNFDIISYNWNFGDGNEGDGQNPTHVYDEPGVYLVCLIIEDESGCVSDVCHEVVVEGYPDGCNAEFTWEQLPGTLQIHFHSTSTSEHDIVSYHWNFGDGHEGDGSNPYHTYAEPGVYLVCLIIEDAAGCVSDVCHEVTVEGSQGECNAEFTWEQIPGTLQIHFHSTSTSEHDIVSYHWNFGDGHEGDGSNPYHTYAEPGVYLVCLIIEDAAGCVSDVCHEVTVEGSQGECNAEFTWEQIPGTLQIHFHSTSTSEHDIVSYHWNFGDGHEGDGSNPYHTYAEPGVYLVCLIIEDAAGCVSDVCHEVTVEGSQGECNAEFTWDQVGTSLEVHFTSTSTSEHDIISYQWNFGDGHTSDDQNPTHTYGEYGTYLVCLIIEDAVGCVSDVCHEVTVFEVEPAFQASFTFEINQASGMVSFNNTSSGTNEQTTYYWEFGDGETSTEEDPQHTYAEPGTYTVCLFITDPSTGNTSHFCHPVTYHENVQYETYPLSLTAGPHKTFGESAPPAQNFRVITYSNPVSEGLDIVYDVKSEATIRFELYDLRGYKVISEVSELEGKGVHFKIMDTGNLTSGLYILAVTTGYERITMRVTISR